MIGLEELYIQKDLTPTVLEVTKYLQLHLAENVIDVPNQMIQLPSISPANHQIVPYSFTDKY